MYNELYCSYRQQALTYDQWPYDDSRLKWCTVYRDTSSYRSWPRNASTSPHLVPSYTVSSNSSIIIQLFHSLLPSSIYFMSSSRCNSLASILSSTHPGLPSKPTSLPTLPSDLCSIYYSILSSKPSVPTSLPTLSSPSFQLFPTLLSSNIPS